MRRLVRLARAGSWPGDAASSLTLAYEDRHRRRVRLITDHGEQVLLDLPHAEALAAGDGLQDEAGAWVKVQAADEDVLDVGSEDPAHLARLAWHLGNRHTPLEVLGDGRLRLAYDHVLAHMLAGLGAKCVRTFAPFQPEAGAYAHKHQHD